MSAARKLLMAAGSARTITDTFDGTENPHLVTTDGTPYVTTAGTLQSTSGRGAGATYPITDASYHDATPALDLGAGATNHSITVTTVDTACGIAVRMKGGNIVTGSWLLSCGLNGTPNAGGGLFVGTGTDSGHLQGISGQVPGLGFDPGDTLTLTACGSTITASKNGTVIYTYNGATDNGGTQVGLYLSTYNSPAGQARFDNLTARAVA